MDALGGGGGNLWWSHHPFNHLRRKRKSDNNNNNKNRRHKASSESAQAANSNGALSKFPLKQALTAGSLALTGDTIAQLTQRWKALNTKEHDFDDDNKDIVQNILSGHDWLRALRMASYGFLFYGPGSYVWYQTLDRYLPQPTVKNLLVKVLLNQIILGPAVIAVVFAWNNLWQGKLAELPRKYQKDALPTLLFGFRFWIPYSVLNFWVVPLQARVGFMSLGSIFWNFILSSTVSK